MTSFIRPTLSGTTALAVSISFVAAMGQSARAADWMYATDASNDAFSSAGNQSVFEIYGMGIKDDGDHVWVGINSGLGVNGKDFGPDSSIEDKNIGWGDLFFDFSPESNFEDSSNASTLFGIHFAANNDTLINGQDPQIGVYGNVKGRSVQSTNGGFKNFGAHEYYVNGKSFEQRPGYVKPTIGDLSNTDSYYGRFTNSWTGDDYIANSIGSGTFLGSIEMLSSQSLFDQGFDIGVFGQSVTPTFGFKFERSLLPDGDFIASIFEECLNDAIALVGALAPPPVEEPPVEEPPVVQPPISDPPISDPVPVPEPGTLLATVMFGFAAFAQKRKGSVTKTA